LSDVGLAATALDAETPPEAKKRSGAGTPEAAPSADVEVDPWLGRVLANVYKVDAKIGEGGMGAVYRATHVHLGKQVAVKVLTDAIAQKRDAVERLRQEAIAASSIDHDNIVDVVSFDRYDDGSVFILMELLRGESLAERMESMRNAGRALSLAETVQIALQICDALGAAHERGIVHRDLKPENVFLAKKGDRERVKVLDFGISKIKTAEAEQVRMTRTGQLVGTPLYMSPEQARGETDIDRRVDVYALGVMLFEMLTGAPPFDGRNYFELLWKHGNEPPPSLLARSPDLVCPPELDHAVQRALAKDRDARFQTMGELAEALRVAVPDLSVPGASIPPELRTSRPSGDGRTPSPTPAPTPQSARSAQTPARTPTPESAAAIESEAPPVRSNALLWVGAAGLFAVVLGGGLYAVMASGSTGASGTTAPPPTTTTEIAPPTTAPPATSPPATTPPTTTPPTTTETTATPLPATVTVSLGSDPLGAEVFAGEARLCTTPCLSDLPGGVEASLTFRREGYQDTIERVMPAEGLAVSPRLRARRRVPSDGTTGAGGGPAIKTTL
jgi:serine/threonine-protein kinase